MTSMLSGSSANIPNLPPLPFLVEAQFLHLRHVAVTEWAHLSWHRALHGFLPSLPRVFCQFCNIPVFSSSPHDLARCVGELWKTGCLGPVSYNQTRHSFRLLAAYGIVIKDSDPSRSGLFFRLPLLSAFFFFPFVLWEWLRHPRTSEWSIGCSQFFLFFSCVHVFFPPEQSPVHIFSMLIQLLVLYMEECLYP